MSQTLETTLSNKPSYRINSIDLLRGLVMIIMALDHTRDFFHIKAWIDNPLNLETTTPILYFTRWITHFCAPTFVFLAGAGAFFQSLRKSTKDLSAFLIKRGFWLIIVEVIIINFAFTFDVHWSITALQTIWSIGISMIILGLVIWLPFTMIVALGFLIVLGHNSLDFYEDNLKGSPGWLYDMVHHVGFYPLGGGHNLLIFYPFLSWAGLMILGYCFGKLFLKYEGAERKKMLLWLGVALLVSFVALRAINIYGDPDPWSTRKTSLQTFYDFMNVEKYPPSLMYMCATIGGAMIFLAFTKGNSRLSKIITVYGRVPFLYYVLHFYLLHFISSCLYLSRGHSIHEGLNNSPNGGGDLPKFIAPTEGYSLLVVYIIWICVVVALYPVCKWFSDYKQKHREKWWLSYL